MKRIENDEIEKCIHRPNISLPEASVTIKQKNAIPKSLYWNKNAMPTRPSGGGDISHIYFIFTTRKDGSFETFHNNGETMISCTIERFITDFANAAISATRGEA